MVIFNKIYHALKYVKRLSLIISGIALAFMILVISVDVFTRNIVSYGIPGSYEIVESIIMPTVIFWAFIITYSSGSIPRIDMLTEKFNENIKFAIGILLISIDIFIYSLMTYYGWSRAEIALTSGVSISAGGSLISIAPVFVFLPIGFLLVTIEAVFILIKMLIHKKYYYSVDSENEPMKE
ncbi:TRAP transporter small permease [Oceanobacillus damuensis]|uniref:TRAP transporter small permease n=1 Tax=Oceanobacillus damuensis TaxID=937928 RepID=UPI0008296465|nr:TRAP transporter small permease [Oceanobacillus damuensis]